MKFCFGRFIKNIFFFNCKKTNEINCYLIAYYVPWQRCDENKMFKSGPLWAQIIWYFFSQQKRKKKYSNNLQSFKISFTNKNKRVIHQVLSEYRWALNRKLQQDFLPYVYLQVLGLHLITEPMSKQVYKSLRKLSVWLFPEKHCIPHIPQSNLIRLII